MSNEYDDRLQRRVDSFHDLTHAAGSSGGGGSGGGALQHPTSRIAHGFVAEYYKTLILHPDQLYNFYTHDSQVIHGYYDDTIGEDEEHGRVVRGRDQVRKLLEYLHGSGDGSGGEGESSMMVRLTSLDSMALSGNDENETDDNILIVVHGSMKRHTHEKFRNFSQTFVIGKANPSSTQQQHGLAVSQQQDINNNQVDTTTTNNIELSYHALNDVFKWHQRGGGDDDESGRSDGGGGGGGGGGVELNSENVARLTGLQGIEGPQHPLSIGGPAPPLPPPN